MKTWTLSLVVALATALCGCAGFGFQRSGDARNQPAAAVVTTEKKGADSASEAPISQPAQLPAAAQAPSHSPVPVAAQAPAPLLALTLAPAKPPAPTGPEKYISLNFDNADISIVIQTIAELLHMNYIVSPSVRGRISIQMSNELPVSALLPVLEQILEVNGFMAVKSGDFFKIVPSAQAKQESVETVLPEQAATASTGLVTKIVQLRYISPAEVVKILTPFKTPAGIYQSHEPARLLFLTEVPAKIASMQKIIEVLDVDTFASIQVELYPVRYAAVEDLSRELNQIVTQVFTSAGRGRTLFRIIPVPSVNAIMVFSGEPGLAANIRDWIAKLDQPTSQSNDRIFVYPLSHATAETLAGVLEKVFRRDTTKTQGKAAAPALPPSMRTAPVPGQPAAATPVAIAAPAQAILSAGESGGSADGAAVTVVADKDTNTLIIQTVSWFYPTVEDVIRKLDTMPKQVLIEVLIAEISLDDTNQYGISWALKGQGGVNAFGEAHTIRSDTAQNLGDLVQNTNGLSILLTEANRLTAVLNAYAEASKLNILSAPHILATNNKEAKIDVGNEVPILKTRTTATAGQDPNTFTNDIEYRSTGVILTVTPHINEGGYVTLDVQQEVSDAQETTLTPIIRKRSAKTTMVVKDNQTLVIGGLIQETRTNARGGLPWLNSIPVLGYLFGRTKTTVKKTELVLLITPRVVNNVEEGDRLTRQVQDRVLTLKTGIEQLRGLKGQGAP